MGNDTSAASRLGFLDQFRGYTVLGMFLVNFVGGCLALPATLRHHHTYCSYADTIMPQFLFAVGFSYRLTWCRRQEREGTRGAFLHALRRNLALALLALVVHHLDGRYDSWTNLQEIGLWGVLSRAFQRSPFQTLLHIAVTSLWVMPVIGARARWRLAWMIGSGVLFTVLSFAFYYDWVWKRPGIDGGPLGFLTWTIPLLMGSLAYDVLLSERARPVRTWLIWGIGLMVFGYGLACLNRLTPPNSLGDEGLAALLVEPPFVAPPQPAAKDKPERWERNVWTMSQRAGSPSYLCFGAGFSLVLLAAFHAVGNLGLHWSYLDMLSRHALAGYIIHDLIGDVVKPFVPRDAPAWYVLSGFAVNLVLISLFVRFLDRNKLFLKL